MPKRVCKYMYIYTNIRTLEWLDTQMRTYTFKHLYVHPGSRGPTKKASADGADCMIAEALLCDSASLA